MRTTFLFILAMIVTICGLSQSTSPSEWFKRLDQNQDGFVSADELPPAVNPELLKRLDRDGDGRISAAEDAEATARQNRRNERRQRNTNRSYTVAPTHADVAYGPHLRNRLDIWLPSEVQSGNSGTPLVVFIHGGGFRKGDKSQIGRSITEKLREKGFAVAAINYRLTDTAPYPAQMHDGARAIQFLRSKSNEWHLDPARIGAMGGSAGAGISQWLTFHDDLADPDNEDPILRQSSRVQCAVPKAAQTTYDPRTIKSFFGASRLDGALFPFYGMTEESDINDPKFHALFEDASPVTHLTADDGPVLLQYSQANTPLPDNPPGHLYIHHPSFSKILMEKAKEVGVSVEVMFREDIKAGISFDKAAVAFFEKHLMTPAD